MGTKRRFATYVVSVALSLGSLSLCADGQCIKTTTSIIHSFSFSGGSRIEALVALGRQEGICFGMRNLPIELFRQSGEIAATDESVSVIVKQIVDDPRIEVRQTEFATVEVASPPSTQSAFDQNIPDFTIPRTALLVSSLAIQSRLARQLDPSIQGFAGSFNPGDRTDVVGPFAEQNKSVEYLLNLVTGQSSKGACWIAMVPDAYTLRASPAVSPIWVVVQYSEPLSELRKTVQTIAQNYPSDH